MVPIHTKDCHNLETAKREVILKTTEITLWSKTEVVKHIVSLRNPLLGLQ